MAGLSPAYWVRLAHRARVELCVAVSFSLHRERAPTEDAGVDPATPPRRLPPLPL